jgi:hypothetical protein
MPRARRRSKPAKKSAEAPTDSTAIVQAEVAGQVNSCGGTQGMSRNFRVSIVGRTIGVYYAHMHFFASTFPGWRF